MNPAAAEILELGSLIRWRAGRATWACLQGGGRPAVAAAAARGHRRLPDWHCKWHVGAPDMSGVSDGINWLWWQRETDRQRRGEAAHVPKLTLQDWGHSSGSRGGQQAGSCWDCCYSNQAKVEKSSPMVAFATSRAHWRKSHSRDELLWRFEFLKWRQLARLFDKYSVCHTWLNQWDF